MAHEQQPNPAGYIMRFSKKNISTWILGRINNNLRNIVLGKEREVDEMKRILSLGEPSDHVAISEAIIRFEQHYNYNHKRVFAREHFLAYNTLGLLSEMKNQFGHNLKQMGFLSSGDVTSAWENRNRDNLSLFKAIVAASLYPNIATVR